MKKIIKSSFKSINNMLGSGFYEDGRIFAYLGKHNYYKNSLLLSECLTALKSGKRVLYVGENNIADVLSKLFKLDNDGANKKYESLPAKRLASLSKTCSKLMVLNAFDTTVSKLFQTIQSFKPEFLVLDEYTWFINDKEFVNSLPTKSIPMAVRNEFYSKIKRYSMNIGFPVLLGIHTYKSVINEDYITNHSIMYMSDFIVIVDQEEGIIKCEKNRWNLTTGLKANMKFGQDGILRDV